jgi:hypothetical protein
MMVSEINIDLRDKSTGYLDRETFAARANPGMPNPVRTAQFFLTGARPL